MPRSITILVSGLTIAVLAASSVGATALTATIGASERSCYYADVDGVGEKVGTYGPASRSETVIE